MSGGGEPTEESWDAFEEATSEDVPVEVTPAPEPEPVKPEPEPTVRGAGGSYRKHKGKLYPA